MHLNEKKINPRFFRDKIKLLRLSEEAAGVFRYREEAMVYAQVSQVPKRTVYSTNGVASDGMTVFYLRDGIANMGHLINLGDGYYFIASITDEEYSHKFNTVVTARVFPVRLTAKSRVEGYDSDMRPKKELQKDVSFIGFLTEKYIKSSELMPQREIGKTMILITHKGFTLQEGALVEADKKQYTVIKAYTQDAYRNEYEIFEKYDV